jgi:hypothetical protein
MKSSTSNMCDMACEILKRTQDGELLDPGDLKLTENAVNGFLNENGIVAFEKLHKTVTDGNYVKPYFHGVEHMTRDHSGYIYYKGIYVEHYSSPFLFSLYAKNCLKEIQSRCEFLEKKGVEVNFGNVIHHWDDYSQEYGAEKLAGLEKLFNKHRNRIEYSKISISRDGCSVEYFVFGNGGSLSEIKNHEITQDFLKRLECNIADNYDIKIETSIYGNDEPLQLADENKKSQITEALNLSHEFIVSNRLATACPVKEYSYDFVDNEVKIARIEEIMQGDSFDYTIVTLLDKKNDKIVNRSRFALCGKPKSKEILKHEKIRELAKTSLDFDFCVGRHTYGEGDKIDKSFSVDSEEPENLLVDCFDDLDSKRLSISRDYRIYNYAEELIKQIIE